MAAEFPPVAMCCFAFIKPKLINHSSEKYFWIKILKPWPAKNVVKRFVNIHKLLFLKKTDLCLPQRFEKIFAHESKYWKIYLNISADN